MAYSRVCILYLHLNVHRTFERLEIRTALVLYGWVELLFELVFLFWIDLAGLRVFFGLLQLFSVGVPEMQLVWLVGITWKSWD